MNSNKLQIKLILGLILTLIIIPNFLLSNHREIEVCFDEKNTNEVISLQTPIESFVYYMDTTGNAERVYVSGNYAYIADGFSGLAVINISDPTNPGTPIYEDTNGYAWGVYVSGNYAYIADGNSGLAVINISDPTNPGLPIYENTVGGATDVYVRGNYAYIADGLSGLAVIDISNPTNPGTPVYEDTNGVAYGVYVSGWYAYIADGYGLAVILISNPSNPGTPIYEDTTGLAMDVYVSGSYAYVADDSSGLAVIDISNPTNPGIPIYEDTTGNYRGVYVSGSYAYVGDLALGLGVINVSNPTNPGTPIHVPSGGDARGVYVSGDYAYVGAYHSGLAIIKIFDPINPGVPIDWVDPIITGVPSDFTIEYGYTGVSISWTATDTNPNIYTIELQGVGVVVTPSVWSSGIAITYNVPDGLSVGEYFYTINITDNYNYVTDTIKMSVIEDTAGPIITDAPSDFTIEYGYTGVSISWTATDTNPNIYTIELQGVGVVVTPSVWSSGVPIIYNVPNDLTTGDYFYTVNFLDDYSNNITDTVKMTVRKVTTDGNGNGGTITFGNYYLIFLIIGIISLVIVQKRRKKSSFH